MPEAVDERTVRWWAPGRVNLIGEHTDYNGGFVLPFAIPRGCTATVSRAAGGDSHGVAIRSAQRDETVTAGLDELADARAEPGRPLPVAALEGEADWARYVAGVIWALLQRGVDVPGLRIEVDSDVPTGAGLSSSAALVCAVATAVDDLLGLRLDADAMLAVSRSAENDVVGAPTGGMDQLASLRCRAGAALFCDMRSLHTEPVPLPLAASGLVVVVLDTRAEHRHSDGEYRARREGCERAARRLGVDTLREVTDLDSALARLDDDELRRYVRHVVTEDDRVLQVVDLLRRGDLRGVGPVLSASHASMRDDYRITIPELDVAAETFERAGALGARMTGGGFGGCVIALLDADRADAAVAQVVHRFAEQGFREPAAMMVEPAAGAHRA